DMAAAYERVGGSVGASRDPAPKPFARLVWATGLAAAQTVPALHAVAHTCADPSPHGTRQESCEAILNAMSRGDTVIIQSLAASIRVRRESAGSPSRIAAEAWRRTLAWQ